MVVRHFDKVKHNKKNKDKVRPYDGVSEVITNEIIARDATDDKFLFWYIPGFIKSAKIFDILKKVKYSKAPRNSGLITTDRIFGYCGRDGIRNFPARLATFHRDQPEISNVFLKLAQHVSNKMEELPVEYEKHINALNSKINKDYIIPSSAFTSGVINKNNQLSYHYDSGNLKGTLGCLLTFREKNTNEGIIHLPDYGIYLKNDNHSLLFFNNRETLHAVTPISKSYDRFTVVFYAMNNLTNALPYKQEIELFNKKQKGKFQ